MNNIDDLIVEFNNDSKIISKQAEKEILGIICNILKQIDNVKNMFGRGYDGSYPKLSSYGFDENCFEIIHPTAADIGISLIDDTYIYLYYTYGRTRSNIATTKIPLDFIYTYLDKSNIEKYKESVISAERRHRINKIQYLEQSLKDAKADFERFEMNYFSKK